MIYMFKAIHYRATTGPEKTELLVILLLNAWKNQPVHSKCYCVPKWINLVCVSISEVRSYNA